MSTWTIRAATPQDAPALTRCVEAAYRHYIPRMGKAPGPMLADYAQEIAQHQVWGVEERGALIGGRVLIPKTDHVLLDNIAVRPAPSSRRAACVTPATLRADPCRRGA